VPGRTNTEAIRELEGLVKTLEERIQSVRDLMLQMHTGLERTQEDHHRLDKEVAVVGERLKHHGKLLERRSTRNWQIWMALVAALLSLLIQALPGLFSYLRPFFPAAR
jgi:hypothetical protein